MDKTKSALIRIIARKRKITVVMAKAIVERIFDAMAEALLRGESIEVRGFGSFRLREYRAYEGRNPHSGGPVHVPKKRLPYFRPGKDLRESIHNSKGGTLSRRQPSSSPSWGGANSGFNPTPATLPET